MAKRQLPEDFREFISFLNANRVEYLLVGGWAIGFLGHPRATKDIDFLIAVTDENLKKLRKTFVDFNAPTIDMAMFKQPGTFFRMGRPPVQIDIVTAIDGVNISDAYQRRTIITIDGIDISVMSRQDLILNKKASGRTQDLADAEFLDNLPAD